MTVQCLDNQLPLPPPSIHPDVVLFTALALCCSKLPCISRLGDCRSAQNTPSYAACFWPCLLKAQVEGRVPWVGRGTKQRFAGHLQLDRVPEILLSHPTVTKFFFVMNQYCNLRSQLAPPILCYCVASILMTLVNKVCLRAGKKLTGR